MPGNLLYKSTKKNNLTKHSEDNLMMVDVPHLQPEKHIYTHPY